MERRLRFLFDDFRAAVINFADQSQIRGLYKTPFGAWTNLAAFRDYFLASFGITTDNVDA